MSRYDGRMIEPKSRGGRPRSEQAREAVLHAVDDLLLEVGYAALTMKGIAERAGVGRQNWIGHVNGGCWAQGLDSRSAPVATANLERWYSLRSQRSD